MRAASDHSSQLTFGICYTYCMHVLLANQAGVRDVCMHMHILKVGLSLYKRIRLRKSIRMYLKNSRAKSHPDPIWKDGTLGIFEDNKNKNKFKTSSDIGSVPGPKIFSQALRLPIFRPTSICITFSHAKFVRFIAQSPDKRCPYCRRWRNFEVSAVCLACLQHISRNGKCACRDNHVAVV